MPTSEISVSDQIRKISPATRSTVRAARRMIKRVAPKAKEIAYHGGPPRTSRYMWKIARYAVDGAPVVGLGTFPAHASLFFYRGRELDDGGGLLVGGGKEMRFITLRTPADAERAVVRGAVRRAFRLQRS